MYTLSNELPVLGPPPAATRTYKPIAHRDLIDEIVRLIPSEFTIRDLRYETSSNGAKLFGHIDLDTSLDYVVGSSPSIGFRSSYDKMLPVGIAVGNRVLVCSNGMMIGETILKKRHSNKLVLDEFIRDMWNKMLIFTKENIFAKYRNRLLETKIKNPGEEIMQLVKNDIIPSAIAYDVWEKFNNPTYEEYGQESVWTLIQAVTERIQGKTSVRQDKTLRKLYELYPVNNEMNGYIETLRQVEAIQEEVEEEVEEEIEEEVEEEVEEEIEISTPAPDVITVSSNRTLTPNDTWDIDEVKKLSNEDKAKIIEECINDFGWSKKQVAEWFGVSPRTIGRLQASLN